MAPRPPFLPLIAGSLRALAGELRPAGTAARTRREPPRHLVVLSQVLWHDVWGRAQELASHLASHLPVTYLSPTAVHRRLEAGERWRAHEERDQGRLAVRCPLTLPGDYQSAPVRRFNARSLVRMIRRWGIPAEESVLLLNTPFLPEVVEHLPWGLAVYDWHDDFAAFPWAPRGAQRLEARTLAHVDTATSGTRVLAETKPGPPRFIPNGVRYEAFAECRAPRPSDLPSGFDHLVGYIGTAGEHFDVELFEEVARRLPRVGFVVIGPVRLARPLQGANVAALGLRPHESLPAYVRHFGAGLIPFKTGPGAEAINPTKLLEYAAAGVPVVSTPLPDVVALFSDCAVVAGTAETFALAIEHALAGDSQGKAARARDRARAASWEETGHAMWEVVMQAWSHRHGSGGPGGQRSRD